MWVVLTMCFTDCATQPARRGSLLELHSGLAGVAARYTGQRRNSRMVASRSSASPLLGYLSDGSAHTCRPATRDSPDDTLLARAVRPATLGGFGGQNSATGAESIPAGPKRSYTKERPLTEGWGREVETRLHARRPPVLQKSS